VARALKKAGAAEVDVLTFARVLPGEGQSETEGKDFRLEEADAI
jgi:hypothetical protein